MNGTASDGGPGFSNIVIVSCAMFFWSLLIISKMPSQNGHKAGDFGLLGHDSIFKDNESCKKCLYSNTLNFEEEVVGVI